MIATEKTKIEASLSNITMSTEAHKMIVSGCIATIGKASTGSPCGAGGKRVAFTQAAIDACGQSFVGMPLNCVYPDWYEDTDELFSDHGNVNIGYIREVHAEGENLMAEIVIWKEKYPDEAYMILNGAGSLGFSLEWYATATHEDEEVIFMDKFEGCGCAILWQNCAAFSDTFIEKLAAAKANRSDVEMTKEEKDALVKEIAASVAESMEERIKSIENPQNEIKASLEAQVSKEDIEGIQNSIEEVKKAAEQAKNDVDAIKAAAEQKDKEPEDDEEGKEPEPLKASNEEIPVPKAGQRVEGNPLIGEDDREAKLAEIKASAMNPMDKLKEITKLRMQG